MNVCPEWKSNHPVAAYVGSSSHGLGFYHVEIPSVESTQWLNLTNCGVVRVKSGKISLSELEAELSEIYCRDWPWQIRELEEGKFLVRFPVHKKVSDIKNYPSFNLRKEGVQVEVLEWLGDLEPFAALKEVWVQILGIPPRWCHWKVFAQIVSSFGLMVDVDWTNIFKTFYEVVRVKVMCRDLSKIPKDRLFEMNKELYVVSFEVEGLKDNGQGGQDGGDDGGNDDDRKKDGLDEDEDDDLLDEEEDHGKAKKQEDKMGKTTIVGKDTVSGSKNMAMDGLDIDEINQEEQLIACMSES